MTYVWRISSSPGTVIDDVHLDLLTNNGTVGQMNNPVPVDSFSVFAPDLNRDK